MRFARVKALTFDVFGTVVDVYGSLSDELTEFGNRRGLTADWEEFALHWIGGYASGVKDVREGRRAWAPVDDLNRAALDGLLTERGLAASAKERAALNAAWLRLRPWPDSVDGLTRLRKGNLRVVTLANGTVAMLRAIADNAGLPWSRILSAELFGCYKPHPDVYRKAARRLRLAPNQIMMVAAHKYDLIAAAAEGFKTAFVPRPEELGDRGNPDAPADWDEFDVVATDFRDLATQLGR